MNFLVQQSEMADSALAKKETLRLDVIDESSTKYKDADIIVFNTAHWWTHDKIGYLMNSYFRLKSTVFIYYAMTITNSCELSLNLFTLTERITSKNAIMCTQNWTCYMHTRRPCSPGPNGSMQTLILTKLESSSEHILQIISGKELQASYNPRRLEERRLII